MLTDAERLTRAWMSSLNLLHTLRHWTAGAAGSNPPAALRSGGCAAAIPCGKTTGAPWMGRSRGHLLLTEPWQVRCRPGALAMHA